MNRIKTAAAEVAMVVLCINYVMAHSTAPQAWMTIGLLAAVLAVLAYIALPYSRR